MVSKEIFVGTRWSVIDMFSFVLIPKKIIKSGDRTIVFWRDDTKTIVKRSDDTEDDLYSAFCAALAKKVYGSNSQVKKILRMADIQPMSDRLRKKEAEEYKRQSEERKVREEAERPQKILEQFVNLDDRTADFCNSGIRVKRRTK